MKIQTIKELMIPVSEYATVSIDASLYEAVLALEKADAGFDPSLPRHRGILVYEKNGKIIGKIGQIDVLRVLEPKYDKFFEDKSFERTGLSPMYRKILTEQYRLWDKPLGDLCRKAAEFKVANFMQSPMIGECVDENSNLNEAIHQFVVGSHQSLLVTRKGDIVGILRLSDMFRLIVNEIKEGKLVKI
ncbi:MAG: CBS domain-containing protein [Desulfobacteraceae bacterium]|nr:CBS domain-containing protein [Desulfobacteraceae bacterium]